MNKRLPIAELYDHNVTQGEGLVRGERTGFLRLGGCDGPQGFGKGNGEGNGQLCGWCWEKGTKILVKRGPDARNRPISKQIPIEEVVEGDWVFSWDGEKDAWTRVVGISKRMSSTIVEIGYFINSRMRKVRVTPEHPFRVGEDWVQAGNLRPGMEITLAARAEVYAATGSKVKPWVGRRLQMLGDGNPMKSPEVVEKNKKTREATRKSQLDIHRLDHDKAVGRSKTGQIALRARMTQAPRRQSTREHYFVDAYKEAGLPVEFIGDGRFWVGPRNPDLLVNGQKKVIELHLGGEKAYPKIRRRDIEAEGYKLLVIDEMNEPSETIKDVWQFITNGAKVGYVLILPGSFEVYDLHCEPYHWYYGAWLLAHNCDTLFSADTKLYKHTWRNMLPEEIVDELTANSGSCRTLTISGGNPVLYDLTELVHRLKVNSWRIFVETQGTVVKPWLLDTDVVTVSPKPPSAGLALPINRLQQFVSYVLLGRAGRVKPQLCIKPVVNLDYPGDYEYASLIAKTYYMAANVHFLSYTDPNDTRDDILDRYKSLCEKVCSDTAIPDVVVGMQEHAALFGVRTQGV